MEPEAAVEPETFLEKSMLMLTADEGIKLMPYKDGFGNFTIGIGHLIGSNCERIRISHAVALQMLHEDIEIAVNALRDIFGTAFDNFDEVRQLALVNMTFNLGQSRFEQFAGLIAATRNENWDLAAKCAADSLWAKQVPKRASRIVAMLSSGVSQYDNQSNDEPN